MKESYEKRELYTIPALDSEVAPFLGTLFFTPFALICCCIADLAKIVQGVYMYV